MSNEIEYLAVQITRTGLFTRNVTAPSWQAAVDLLEARGADWEAQGANDLNLTVDTSEWRWHTWEVIETQVAQELSGYRRVKGSARLSGWELYLAA